MPADFASRTLPVERDRFMDALRVLGVAIVVLGHWSVMMVFWDDDRIRGVNALSVIPALRLVTWVVQVMPLMFFLGGFANSVSTDERAGSYAAFLRDRLVRLLGPTTVFLAVWMLLGILEEAVDLGTPSVLRRGADVAALPFWFLGIYLVAVGLAPAMLRLHRRFRWWVPGGLAAAAGLVDWLARGLGMGDLGALNYAFVWLLAHQLGYFYADGTLTGWPVRRHLLVALTGVAGMVALVTIGTYPVSVVEVPGEPVSNTAPPSVMLLFLALWLIGMAMAARGPVTRWLRRMRPWRMVRKLNRMVLSAYLWHVTAISAAVAILYPLGFPQPEIGTGRWWALRPAFVAAMVPVLAVLVLVFRRFEIHLHTAPIPGPFAPVRAAATAFGVFALAVAILGFGVTGFIDLAASDGAELLVFSFNPVQNLAHFLIGAMVVAAVLRGAGPARAALAVGALLFLAGGWWELGAAETPLGMNATTAGAHLVSGGLGALGVLLRGGRRSM